MIRGQARKPAYYRVKRARAFWVTTAAMRAHGFQSIPLGDDGPAARALAETWNARWRAARRGGANPSTPAEQPIAPITAPGSLDESGYVYFLRSGDRIKIGFSRNPFVRASKLSTGLPAGISSIFAVPGSRRDERRLHQRFAPLRQHGEWFVVTGALLREIARMFFIPGAVRGGKTGNKVAQSIGTFDPIDGDVHILPISGLENA